MIGNGKTFYCKSCHNLGERISLLTNGCIIGRMWREMDVAEKASFRLEYSNLQKAALREKLSVTIAQKIISTEDSWTGSHGSYYPISWYKGQGYDNAFCAYIEATCPCRREGPHATYALKVHGFGDQRRIQEVRESLWRPVNDLSNKRKRSEASGSSASSDNSSTSSEDEDSEVQDLQEDDEEERKTPKKAKQKQEHKKGKQLKFKMQKKQAGATKKSRVLGSRVWTSCGSALHSLQALEDRLTMEVRLELPEFQVKDFEASGQRLKELQSKWNLVLKGKSTQKEEQVDEATTTFRISQAKTGLTAFARLLDSAEKIVEVRCGQEQCPMDKEEKKQKDKGSKKARK